MSYSFDANRWRDGSRLGWIGRWFIYLHSGRRRTIHTPAVLSPCCRISRGAFPLILSQFKEQVWFSFYFARFTFTCLILIVQQRTRDFAQRTQKENEAQYSEKKTQSTAFRVTGLREFAAPHLVLTRETLQPPLQSLRVNKHLCVNLVFLSETCWNSQSCWVQAPFRGTASFFFFFFF